VLTVKQMAEEDLGGRKP